MKMKQEDEEVITSVAPTTTTEHCSIKSDGEVDVPEESIKLDVKIAIDTTSDTDMVDSNADVIATNLEVESAADTTTVTTKTSCNNNNNSQQSSQNNGQPSIRKYNPNHYKVHHLNHNASPWTPSMPYSQPQPHHHHSHHTHQLSLPLPIPPPPNHLNHQHMNLNLNLPPGVLPPHPSLHGPLPQQNANNLPAGIGMIPAIPTGPLPTALFPLPFSPSLPPAVLPSSSYNGNHSSGYSTAGHSMSSSPVPSAMMAQPKCQGLGLPLCSTSSEKVGRSSSSCSSSNRSSPNPNVIHSLSTSVLASSSESGNGKSGTNLSKAFSSSSALYVGHNHNAAGNSAPNNCPAGSGSHYHHQHGQHPRHNPNSCSYIPQGGGPGGAANPNTSPNLVFAAPSTELTVYSHFPTVPGQHVVYFHINPGVSVSFNIGGDQMQIIKGPMTVPMVSTNSNPPIPLPMQVPQGHVVQQIVDESGTLRHVIVSHQPPLMPIPAYGSQNQPYYGAGYSGGPYASMQGVPCGPHSHSGPPTPPSGVGTSGYHLPSHKDERAQRQFTKLRRKFEQGRQREREPVPFPNHYNQNGTYRRDGVYNNNNNLRRNAPNGSSKTTNGGAMEETGSTGSVGSTGTQDEEEEHRILQQTEMLSTLIPPSVSDVASRSAFIKWSHPDRFTETGENKFPDLDISDTEFRYEVFISDRTRGDRFKSIFLGTALSCRVKDLKPGTIYAIQYSCMLNDLKGNTCAPTNFTTLPAEPDAPACPKALTRNRTSISFKWNPPASENGSKITSFLLEYDEGKGGSHFVEVYRGKNKSYIVPKLQPAYSYQFRLAAINQCGQSRYSPVTSVMTMGSPPAQPLPPIPAEVGVKFLTLEWRSRPTDDQYTLQMEDPLSGHGFLCVYNGNAPHYTCVGLKGNTPYRFRVKAQNEEGHSKYSDDVVIQTLPDRPAAPRKPILKGRIHSSGFKVRWEPPSDGGVRWNYSLEIDQGNGRFEEIYRGPEHEFLVDNLNPGQSYPLRVIAIGVGGLSDPSDPCVITTEPVCPGKCSGTQVVGKPKSNSVHLKWNPPDLNGGSPVNQYEVGCTTSDNQTQEAYRGKETYCLVNRLLPGRSYVFQIRAYNRIGAGPWSEPLELISGAGQPDSPLPPKVCNKSPHSLVISWVEPLNNGSGITEYRVQMATLIPVSPQSLPPPLSPVDEPTEIEAEGTVNKVIDLDTTDSQGPVVQSKPIIEDEEATLTSFSQVFAGAALSCEVKGLLSATVYQFRVQAGNVTGFSEWSPATSHQMPASSPSAVINVEGTTSSSSISLTWDTPASNGSAITQYNVMLGETVFVAESNTYLIENLMPDTLHKIRIQAVNGVGPGPFSSTLKILTKSLPPQPPRLEMVSSAHSWMKLKWQETCHKNIEYIVQMINPYHDEFQVVYRGPIPSCKVTRLTEDTEYQYRICALNSAGQGQFSDMCKFRTLKAPPPQVKGLKSTLLKDLAVTRFEWTEISASQDVTYQFQVAKKKDHEFKTLHRGETKRFDLKNEDLEAGVDYVSRVCSIRQCDEGNQLVGPYSSLVNFRITLEEIEVSPSLNSAPASSFKSNLTATAQALEDKMKGISYESRVGIMAVITLILIALVISMITHHVVS